ncbi:MAG TPA: glutathione S-transferase [Aeromonadales bacterium]|nr:glutathione S-transferase [Aeromonadales bacterium]
MITVHHLNNSRSQRILWMLEELGVDYEIKKYQRNTETQLAPENLKQIHPLGKSPVITDNGENNLLTIAESGAIIDYLGLKYSKGDLRPDEDSPSYLDYNYWLQYSEGSVMPPLLLRLIFERIKTSPMPFFAKPIARGIANKVLDSFVMPNIKNNTDFIENHLSNQQWFAGDEMTGADIQMSFPLEASLARGLIDDNYPNIQTYVKNIHARPAYQRGLEKGGQYDYA